MLLAQPSPFSRPSERQPHSRSSNLYSSVTLSSGRNPPSPNDTFHAARYPTEGRAPPGASLPSGYTILPDQTSHAQMQTSPLHQQNPGPHGFLNEEIHACRLALTQVYQDLWRRRQSRLGREVSSAQAQIRRDSWVENSVRSAMEAMDQNLRQPIPEPYNIPAPASSSQATQQVQDYQYFPGQAGPSSRVGGGSMRVPISSVTASYSDPAMPSQWNRSGVPSTRVQEEQSEESNRYHPPPAPSLNSSEYPLPMMPPYDVFVLQRRVQADLGQRFRDALNR
jgi:hypothetical protein